MNCCFDSRFRRNTPNIHCYFPESKSFEIIKPRFIYHFHNVENIITHIIVEIHNVKNVSMLMTLIAKHQ